MSEEGKLMAIANADMKGITIFDIAAILQERETGSH